MEKNSRGVADRRKMKNDRRGKRGEREEGNEEESSLTFEFDAEGARSRLGVAGGSVRGTSVGRGRATAIVPVDHVEGRFGCRR